MLLALPVFSYMLGSISFGLWFAKHRGVDLRATGSGNTGATNVGRALGRGTGRVVLLLDALKGFAPVVVAVQLAGVDSAVTCATGIAAVVGHIYPLWHGFRGGKGAATGAGVLVGAVPGAGVAAFVTYLLLKRLTRRASVGSLGGTLVGLAGVAASSGMGYASAMALGVTILVWWRHAPNLRRLWRGQEPPEGEP